MAHSYVEVYYYLSYPSLLLDDALQWTDIGVRARRYSLTKFIMRVHSRMPGSRASGL